MLVVFPCDLAHNSMLYLLFFYSKLVHMDSYIMILCDVGVVACSRSFWRIQIMFCKRVCHPQHAWGKNQRLPVEALSWIALGNSDSWLWMVEMWWLSLFWIRKGLTLVHGVLRNWVANGIFKKILQIYSVNYYHMMSVHVALTSEHRKIQTLNRPGFGDELSPTVLLLEIKAADRGCLAAGLWRLGDAFDHPDLM